MAGQIYRKPVLFAVMALVVLLVGTVATMFLPMLREDMHPKLAGLKPFTALQLAGRDVYQREGCMGCHTQTVRPLASEVARYGDYSKAGEFYYDRPHLWGSKRTGPDLARVGGKYNDAWHYRHYEDPRAIVPKSNMPSYAFLAKARVDAGATRTHMAALGLPYTDADISALAGKTEMDALVAYTQWLGHAVARRKAAPLDLAMVNPTAGRAEAVARGRKLFADNCAVCHGEEGEGVEGVAPSLVDEVFLGETGDMPDAAYFALISSGSDAKESIGRKGDPNGGMQAFAGPMTKDDIWSLVSFIRSKQKHESAEHGEHHQGGDGR
jgi:cytochrome c oxidase cbb3-type subunit 2